MADVLPVSCGAIVRHGAVPAFCQRLLTIEYIDLAEQSLQVCTCTISALCVQACATCTHIFTHECGHRLDVCVTNICCMLSQVQLHKMDT
eukprot:316571-Pelagomonas_calceolata.AAC.4